MRPKPRLIVLGDKSWIIRPFMLSELQTLEPIVANEADHSSIQRSIEIITNAVSRDYPADQALIPNLETTWPELNTAVRHILEIAGYITESPATEGEARAAEASAAVAV